MSILGNYSCRRLTRSAFGGAVGAAVKSLLSAFAIESFIKLTELRLPKRVGEVLSAHYSLSKVGERLSRQPRRLWYRLGLGCLPLFPAHLTGLVNKNKDAFLVAYNDVGQLVAIDVGHGDLGAHAGIRVDQVGNKINRLVGIADGFEPCLLYTSDAADE